MASFNLQWRASTRKDLRRLPPDDVARIVAVAAKLGDEPLPHGISSVNILSMSHTLDVYDFRVAEEFIHDSVIADANAVGTFGTA